MLRNLFACRFGSVGTLTVAGSLIFGSAGVGGVLAQAPMVDITPGPATIAITGGKLLTITHGVIENGVVLIEGGKITAVGTAASVKVPKGATIVDAKGMTVYPGLIDAETRLGLSEIASDRMTNDTVEPSEEIFPQMHVYDAFHAESKRGMILDEGTFEETINFNNRATDFGMAEQRVGDGLYRIWAGAWASGFLCLRRILPSSAGRCRRRTPRRS